MHRMRTQKQSEKCLTSFPVAIRSERRHRPALTPIPQHRRVYRRQLPNHCGRFALPSLGYCGKGTSVFQGGGAGLGYLYLQVILGFYLIDAVVPGFVFRDDEVIEL